MTPKKAWIAHSQWLFLLWVLLELLISWALTREALHNPALSITPQPGSVYIMQPGCQELFKHRILSDRKISGTRFSLSFRCMKVEPTLATTPSSPGVSDLVSHFENGPDSQLQQPLQVDCTSSSPGKSLPLPTLTNGYQLPPPAFDKPQDSHQRLSNNNNKFKSKVHRKRTTVLFGTSITQPVIGKRLGRKGRNVINISESGANIRDISDMVDDFARYDPAADDVEKVVLCFGTNDVKFQKKGVGHLRSPVFDLINKVKGYFPGAIILVVSTLPMRNMYWYTAPNFLNFNDILRDASYKTNCYYVDCFSNFLSEDRYDYNKSLFADPWHLNRMGLGIFCSILKAVINCNSFSSVIRTDYGYYF